VTFPGLGKGRTGAPDEVLDVNEMEAAAAVRMALHAEDTIPQEM
jgi:hypothetical protein